VNIVSSPAELRKQIHQWKKEEQLIGLVPTMGFFHKGHIALMKESKKRADKTVVSIFVNPLQFGANEDLDKYPRDLEHDTLMATEAGVDLLFLPLPETMYPDGYQTTISVADLARNLCGSSRPGHFTGVATIVTKLFNLVQPDMAVFGEKDFQQLAILKQMVKDLNFPIDIVGHPIVREVDGLAMSSRNKNLSETDRAEAISLYTALQYAKNTVWTHSSYPAEKLVDEVKKIILSSHNCRLDYIEIVDPETLEPLEEARKGSLLALAVYYSESVRLIDNAIL